MRPRSESAATGHARSGYRRVPWGHRRVARAARALTGVPELNLLAFGFLLHLPWELWLSGIGTSGESHLQSSGELPLALSLAALAHAGINVAAFWFIAAGARTRRWIRAADRAAVLIFAGASVMFTLIVESLVIGVLTQWEHPAFLPTFIAPGIELPSVLQAAVTPLLMVAVVRRQLRSPSEE